MYHINFSGFSCIVPENIYKLTNDPYRLFHTEYEAACFAGELAQMAMSIIRKEDDILACDMHFFWSTKEATVRVRFGDAHWTVEEWMPDIIIHSFNKANDIYLVHGFSSIDEMQKFIQAPDTITDENWNCNATKYRDDNVILATYKGKTIMQAKKENNIDANTVMTILSKFISNTF